MKPTAYQTQTVKKMLMSQKIATLSEIKTCLGTSSTMTVFRKLKELNSLTSYSHRGKYYTLDSIAHFDENGLWSHRLVWFSSQGNLLETVFYFVEKSEAGFTANELKGLLHVEVKEALLKLYHQKRLVRDKFQSLYVYASFDQKCHKRQYQRREALQSLHDLPWPVIDQALSHELNAAIILFFSLLDEQQRRLFAGLESQKLGHGGDRKIAQFLGLSPTTVARGRRELFSGNIHREGIRSQGGGRPSVEKKPRT